MTASRARVWTALAAYVVVAAAAVAWRQPPLTAAPPSVVVGVVAGAVLFVFLSGRPRLRRPRCSRGVLWAFLAMVVGAAATEEAVWRLGATALFVRAVPVPVAAVLAVGAFAIAHAEQQGLRGAVTHLVSGSAFMGVYLATGRLIPAVAAHATYNLLVACAAPVSREAALAASVVPAPIEAIAVPTDLAARFSGVRKRFGAAVALDGFDLALPRGEVACLLGPNGAGKSTAVSLLIGLRRPDAGSVLVFGRDPRQPETRLRLGVVAQEVAYPGTLRVREVAQLAAAHFVRAEDPNALLDRFGLQPLASRQTGGLSGGERRRLGIALAFAGRPDLLVLDEPTVGLDVEARARTWAEISRFAECGGTVLFTTHHLEEAESMATTAFVLSRGRLVAGGTLHDIRAGAGRARIALRRQPLPTLPGVVDRRDEGPRTTLVVDDVEAVLDGLRRVDADLSGVEIRSAGLEELLRSLAVGEGE